MPFSEVYRKQAALVVRALPEVAREDCFALKGGTGINLFIRDMPRLSVDIDLTYLPVSRARAISRCYRRSLVDVCHLLQNEGVDDSLRRAFVVYLVSHDRPMFEVLAGTRRDISKEFDHGFEGMTTERVLLRASYLTPRRR